MLATLGVIAQRGCQLSAAGVQVSIAYTPNASNLEHVYEFVTLLKHKHGVNYSRSDVAVSQQ